MRYPVAIWEESGTYSAAVPDLPGVITEADSIEELVLGIEEASLGWMEAEIDDGRDIPKPSLVEKYFKDEDYKNCVCNIIFVITRGSPLLSLEKVNIILQRTK